MLDSITALRNTLHRFPELSGQEQATAARIRDFIRTHHNTTIIEEIGGTGLAAVYSFPEPGPVVMIRCELDALPIHESLQLDHASEKEGVSHKCGHDGHMAMVAGLIFRIQKRPFRRGTIVLLFQPAEETGKGALAVLGDPKFKTLEPDYIFALHNIPGEPLHTILKVENSFSCTVQSLAVYVTGKSSHAAEPENGINPARAIAKILLELETLNVSSMDREDFAVLTPVYLEMGEKAYGMSAGLGEVHFTIRTTTDAGMEQLTSKIKQIIQAICEAQQLEFRIDWFDYFPAVANHPENNDLIVRAALKNGFDVKTVQYPFKFGEDMGWFSQKYKTAMFGIGAGINSPALHHADYDFPDALLPTGTDMFGEILALVLD